MPSAKTSPPKKKKKSPIKSLLFTLIVICVVVLGAAFWPNKKPARPGKTIPETPVVAPQKTNQLSAPARVLVMTKTNSPNKVTNVVSAFPAEVRPVEPPVAPRTNLISSPPVPLTTGIAPRTAQNIFEAQLALTRQGISPGSIDGSIGSQTRAALKAFQMRENLPVTGELDAATKAKLLLPIPSYGEFVVTANDLARLQPLGTNWRSKSEQTKLDYETLLELVAEKSCSNPGLIKQLNPSVNWSNIPVGTVLRVPVAERAKPNASAAFVRISLSGKNLKAFDEQTNLLAHFPCSIAQKVEKRPVGELHVEKIAVDPDYTFNPENFPESPEARSIKSKLILSPGPNNPVGTVWIGLNKPGYGIHGTPKPEEVGRTESHGCFRLANWNAEYLVRLISVGTPILVEP